MSKAASFLVLAGGPSLRTAEFLGRPHLVVPVVALVEGVLFAANAEHPELVTAKEFSRGISGWNGRPVVLDHPEEGGKRVSAGAPSVLDRAVIGSIFNTRVEHGKLKMDAWIDKERVPQVAGAEGLLERFASGERVEVSVGVFVTEDPTSGIYNGKRYAGVWRDIVPDHLAILPKGTTGACSVSMGCGAPRAASANDGKAKEARVAKEHRPGWKETLSRFLSKFRTGEDVSDRDVREGLSSALRATVPAFLGVKLVYPESSTCIYCAAPGEELQHWKVSYTVDADGKVSLAGDDTEVQEITSWSPVGEGGTSTTHEGGEYSPAPEGAPMTMAAKAAAKPKEEIVAEVSKEKKDRVAAVVARLAAKSNLFKPCDGALIESWPDERIAVLEAQATELEKAPVKIEEPKVAAAKTPAEIEAEYLASAPESVRNIVEKHKAASARHKAEMVASLKTAAAGVYTDEELAVMDESSLEKLVALSAKASPKKAATDFGPSGARSAGSSDRDVPKPIDMNERIKTARAKQVAS